MVLNGAEWCRMVQSGAEWCRMGPNGAGRVSIRSVTKTKIWLRQVGRYGAENRFVFKIEENLLLKLQHIYYCLPFSTYLGKY